MYINMSMVYLFYEVIILEIKVALISDSLWKAASRAVKNNGLSALISYLLAVPWPEWGMGGTDDGFNPKQQLPVVVRLTWVLFVIIFSKICLTDE